MLADVVEPVKDYHRTDGSNAPMDFHAPLTHLIDAVYPESDVARKFSDLVGKYTQSGYKDQALEAQIREQLAAWRDNDAKLHSLLMQSFLLAEVAPLSQELSALAGAGTEALDALDKSQPTPDSWRTQQLATIEQAKKPTAGLLLMVAEPVQHLIEASASPHN